MRTQVTNGETRRGDIIGRLPPIDDDEPELLRNTESREERFIRIVVKRVTNLGRACRLVGNCASSDYAYTPAQVEQVFEWAQQQLDRAKARFEAQSVQGEFRFR